MFDCMATATTAAAQAALAAAAGAAASGRVTTPGSSSSSAGGGGFLDRILGNVTAQPVRRNRPSSTLQLQHSSAQAAAAHHFVRHGSANLTGTAGRGAADAAGMAGSNSQRRRSGVGTLVGRGAAGSAAGTAGRNSSAAAQLGAMLAATRSASEHVGRSAGGCQPVAHADAARHSSRAAPQSGAGLHVEARGASATRVTSSSGHYGASDFARPKDGQQAVPSGPRGVSKRRKCMSRAGAEWAAQQLSGAGLGFRVERQLRGAGCRSARRFWKHQRAHEQHQKQRSSSKPQQQQK
jgi:hypothetical protein